MHEAVIDYGDNNVLLVAEDKLWKFISNFGSLV